MKISTALLSTVLFAATALAAPPTLARRVKQRQVRQTGDSPSSQPVIKAASEDDADPTATTVQYSSNWAGAVLTAPPADATFISVIGTFIVPEPSPPTSGEGSWYGSAWVGIDGDTYQDAILQTGVDWEVTVSSTGEYSYTYNAWYEWYPNGLVDYDFTVNAGDNITAYCISFSDKEGYTVMINNDTGDTVSTELTAPSSTAVLGGQNAEWIVEDYGDILFLYPFADFGTVTFTDCSASAVGNDGGIGIAYTLYPNADTATVINIEQTDVLTSVSFPGTNEVSVSYI